MLSYSTIPADEAQQPVKGASWKRVVVVAATASFVLGTVVLRSATPLTTALHSAQSPFWASQITLDGGELVGQR